MKRYRKFCYGCIALLSLGACTSGKLTTYGVGYQSVRTEFARPVSIPDDAKIEVIYYISEKGEITPVIFNKTDDILTIDQTKSFFINPNGVSRSYYDPTLRVSSTGNYNSNTSGAAFNWGAVAGALGIGGPLGSLMGGLTSMNSATNGVSNTYSEYLKDEPMVSIGPRGSGAVSKNFEIGGIGKDALKSTKSGVIDMNQQSSPVKFSICITYSLDGGNTFEKLITNFYMNSSFSTVVKNGNINDGFRQIYIKKPDALAEYWFLIHINNNMKIGYNTYTQGFLIDYK